MKIVISSILLFILFQSSIILSQNKDLGVGVILGDPTGLSAKYWTNASNAIDLAVGYSFIGPSEGVGIHIDYLYHVDNLIKSKEPLVVYYGYGLRIRILDDHPNIFGVRGVGGILWYPKNLPLDVFAEIVPSFRLLPNADLDLSFGIGSRYYFTF